MMNVAFFLTFAAVCAIWYIIGRHDGRAALLKDIYKAVDDAKKGKTDHGN